MKKIVTLFSLGACLAFFAGTILAQDTTENKPEKQHPRKEIRAQVEKDGFIKIEDIKNEKMANHFKKLDTNADGKVCQKEFKEFHEKMRAEFAKKHEGKPGPKGDRPNWDGKPGQKGDGPKWDGKP
ncbi:MAG: hypothetical protein Q4C96_09355, partial [Planctomycetia bacterium]|nr:hypothetical protein [Planctomycetia bacterium]